MLISLPVSWVVLLRFIIPLFLMVLVAIVTEFPKFPAKESWIPMLIRCLCFFLTQYFIFLYLYHGSFVIAAVLTCTTPIFVPILDHFFYHMHMSLKMWVSIIISFIGILIVLHPDVADWNAWALLGLLSGMFSALGQISFNQIAKREKPQDTAFYLFLFGSLFSIILTAFISGEEGWDRFNHLIQNGDIILSWILFGLLTIFVQVFRSRAYASVNKTGSIMPLSYFTIVFSTIIAWVAFDQILSSLSWLGIALIIIGGVILLHRKRQPGVG